MTNYLQDKDKDEPRQAEDALSDFEASVYDDFQAGDISKGHARELARRFEREQFETWQEYNRWG
jgi:hypothetical protein